MIAANNTSYLARIKPGWKFGALLVLSIALYLITSWIVLLALFVFSAAILLSAHVDFRQLRLPLISITLILGVVFILLGLQTDWLNALRSVLRLLTMCLLAYAVSLTTKFEAMLELFQQVASPVRFIGGNPAQIALALSMTIRFIPELKKVYIEVREAQHARGLANNPLAVTVPLVIRSLKIADETAEALDARGYDSEPAKRRF
ncbi:energy-coupling factor transporter transmembrane protein EcfT [Glutamicibacter sp. JL.03c]|uniref:energy-coupling factor transporter transmembrane component T family protein n=1 Tax=Glutamicibacter sp. JL.03c TaxID=2984842 RepID=UPI0021F6C35C|nr:energy-coupling factor transporter transmembrane component T [Glutamicibacter sp. JL.03c]UYQ76201.1 energy-coupling factor transporter transmembrane protein EcfT [Glutamicibacter sp. JL.03c]